MHRKLIIGITLLAGLAAGGCATTANETDLESLRAEVQRAQRTAEEAQRAAVRAQATADAATLRAAEADAAAMERTDRAFRKSQGK